MSQNAVTLNLPDDVYENAKAVFENLLGPIWDTGGDTQIYYPRVP